ncbi:MULTISPECIES: S4 domain-containing protein [unclassified Endozoicomonas]|uniref:S4 domain-containing protein n=1 Tax=unclassified Endozoicomonas TaxID=2644528 RepID=UPI003BB7DFA9
MIRLSMFIADAGYCSRREASRLIESGCVLVNGRPGLHIDQIASIAPGRRNFRPASGNGPSIRKCAPVAGTAGKDPGYQKVHWSAPG